MLRIALFMAVATAALPYLARGLQRLVEIFIALTALATAVGGHGLPLNVGGSMAIGWGEARYQATETRTGGSPGGRLGIGVCGRDAADARLLTKAGRFLLYRDPGPTFTITRLQQAEREAYLTLRAGQAGAAVPELVEAGTAGPAKDALLACRLPAGPALAEADATAAVFIQRLFTSYLPPIWGWVTLIWMRKRDYL